MDRMSGAYAADLRPARAVLCGSCPSQSSSHFRPHCLECQVNTEWFAGVAVKWDLGPTESRLWRGPYTLSAGYAAQSRTFGSLCCWGVPTLPRKTFLVAILA